MTDGTAAPFHGAKAATFIGDKLLVILRDDKPNIPYPDHWDFPGGGREGSELGQETLAREMDEEVGLDLTEAESLHAARLPSDHRPGKMSWFFVVRFAEGTERQIRFGDEGQRWALMSVDEVLALPNLVPSMGQRLRNWLANEPHCP